MLAGKVTTGLDGLLAQPLPALRGRRLGLLMNQASVTGRLEYACDALERVYPGQLTALFSPQHGLWGEQQANMIESSHSQYRPLGVPVYSLYSETRRPTPAMLAEIDYLLIDLQDVGTRVYTFVWTLLHCLEACAQSHTPVVVLDRPNPIGGCGVEGPLLATGYESFVGLHPIPLRHGLTLGELAQLLLAERNLDVDLTVVPLRGWHREMLFAETGLPWIWPSPNMPTPDTAVVYPGQVLLEGLNLSEGRGTTRPFEVLGAPFLDPWAWRDAMQAFQTPGLCLRPIYFQPTFDKWAGERCGGLELQIVDAAAVRSVHTTVSLIATALQLAPQHVQWLPPPYEYEFEKLPIDILFGTAQPRERLDALRGVDGGAAAALQELEAVLQIDLPAWQTRTHPHLLYPSSHSD